MGMIVFLDLVFFCCCNFVCFFEKLYIFLCLLVYYDKLMVRLIVKVLNFGIYKYFIIVF